ncbi:MAG: phenylalanine--tRNA ligase subunit beta, partial [Tsuneonella sp.]
DDTMTVIADRAMVHDIGGIMGGEHSGVTAGTTDVLLEIAYFDPARIGATGRKLGIASDARGRFERGVDPAFLDAGLDILTDLILRTCGGEASEVVRAGAPPSEARIVTYDPQLAQRLGGIAIAEAEQRAILEKLDFHVSPDWQVSVPLRRHDVEGPADLVEEVVRIHGLDSVPSTPLPRIDGVARPTATPDQARERKVRRAAAARGLNEAVTWSFLPPADADHFADGNGGLWVLENPISEDMKAMRPSLIPGLLAAAKRNVDRGADSVRLFEVGRRYLRGEAGASDERATVGVLLAGEKQPRGWSNGKAAPFDAFDAKAEAMALLEAAGAPVANLQVMGEAGGQFHPGQSATLRLGPKTVLARFGALHPATLKAFDVDGPVMAVEVFLDAIPPKKTAAFARPAYAPPALQSVTRDFAFLVDVAMPAGDLLRKVKGADKANIVAARVFDDFRGQGVPEGKKSLAIEVTMQPTEKSFTDADLKALSDKVVAAAAKMGAELRA